MNLSGYGLTINSLGCTHGSAFWGAYNMFGGAVLLLKKA